MLLNDLNTSERTVSPLSHDYDGRFSRKGQKVPEVDDENNSDAADSILVILYITFLMATDFILFAGSGNIEVFRGDYVPIPEVSFLLAGIFLFSICFVFLFHKSVIIRSAIAGLFSLGFVYVLFKQFSQFRQLVAIGDMVLPSYLILGIILAALTFVFFIYQKIIFKLLLVVASGVLFAHVYLAYMEHKEPHEFIESHNIQKAVAEKNRRFIYFMFPNLASYSYLSTIPTSDSLKTRQIMQGFYQKNKFKVFAKAFVPENGYLGNMISSLNPSSTQTSDKHVLDTRLLSEYWRFYNLRNEYIYLKNNELYDIFKQNNFQLSAYKSRDFDMCHKQHKYNVQRCIEKVNQPTNIYDMKLSIYSRANILLVEWLASMQVFENMSSLYMALTSFMNVDKAPMVGVNYNNLYVVNSTKTFDILLENIKADSGKQAYFVFADIPSDMYIYDEFCQLKPKDEWLDMANLPWMTTDYSAERQTAYLQQTRCLYGKLQQFLDNMRKDGLLENSVIVLQGISGVNDFQNYYSDDFMQNFIGNRLVNMAIYDGKSEGTDWSFCATNNILTDYLYKTKKCLNKSSLGVHEKIYQGLNAKLDSLLFYFTKDSTALFEDWYKKWFNVNGLNIDLDKDTLAQKLKDDTETLVNAEENDNSSVVQDENEHAVPDLNEELFEE